LPQYASQLTGEPIVGEIMWKYVIWYYNQLDVVYVPSEAIGEELKEKGISAEKIRFYQRGIDVNRFHPSKRNGFLRSRYDISDEALKLLYVGRVSREKNIEDLVAITKALSGKRNDFHLVIVGDGPFRREMEAQLTGYPVTCTGYLDGDDLAQAYASSDIFVFPSATDTFGNVVLEAQASGIPAVVTDQGGPKENLIDGDTGFVVPAGDINAFTNKLLIMMDQPAFLSQMKQNARQYMQDRGFESAFLRQWEGYRSHDINAHAVS